MTTKLLGINIIPTCLDEAVRIVVNHVNNKKGDYFCLANIHLVMEANKHEEIKKILNNSAGNFPDGMGVAWALKLSGHNFKGRVRGSDLMLELCSYASKEGLSVYFYGNTPDTVMALIKYINNVFPGLKIEGFICPPFRDLKPEEDRRIINEINASQADLLFVSLGAPKQEKWMAEHKEKIKAVQIGVGAAFDFVTGKIKQAPTWMQKIGFEWLYRLPQQPKKTIYRMMLAPKFIYRVVIHLITHRLFKP